MQPSINYEHDRFLLSAFNPVICLECQMANIISLSLGIPLEMVINLFWFNPACFIGSSKFKLISDIIFCENDAQ